MKEHACEEQLALFATGDLATDEQGTVAAHVGACAECRNTAAGFREMQGFISSGLIDPAAAELVEVRERVVAKLRQHQNMGWRWAWGLAGAAAILALAVVPLRFEHRQPLMPTPAPTVARSVPPRETLPAAAETAVPHARPVRHREAGIRSVALITRANQPPLIKMTTADPNVVILWQSNQTEDEE